MTTCFDTKDWAIKHGLSCVGRHDIWKDGNRERTLKEILAHPEVKEIKDKTIGQFGFAHEGCTMIQVKTRDGKKDVIVASTNFRDGYDCWVVDPKTGLGMRLTI